MKKLIFAILLVPLTSFAIDEMSDTAIKNKFMTVVKDAEVEKMLGATTEFNDCRKDNEFKSTDSQAERTKKLSVATECFKKKVGGKNADALKKLAEELKLENYGLVKSKSVNDITEYLSKKMTKALSGRDPDDKSVESLKWENQKIVDQKVFIDLYTNQLVKSALFEVSRFCFENLRREKSVADKFDDHWNKGTIPHTANGQSLVPAPPILADINDSGSPAFAFSSTTDFSKKEDAYKDIISSLGASVDSATYDLFFKYCQAALPILCNEFRANVQKQTKDAAGKDQTVVTDNYAVKTMSKGANACLTIDKLQSIRTAMANTEKVAKQFDEMGEEKDKFAIQMIKNPKLYQRGKGDGEESLDELTSMSSTDMMGDAKNDELDDLSKKCGQNGGGGSDCDQFLVEGDHLDKAIHNVESEMNLKREIELEQVRKMASKPEDLEKYLEENGHFDLLNKIKDKTLSYQQIEGEISKVFDARKVAEIEALKMKVGKRQVSEKEMAAITPADKSQRIQDNITESKQERARLAQVVLFNNIITSQLSLEEKGTGKQVGRNVNAWKKEGKALDSAGIDVSLFAGIQDIADKEGSKLEDTSVVGGGIIDSILGKQEEKKP